MSDSKIKNQQKVMNDIFLKYEKQLNDLKQKQVDSIKKFYSKNRDSKLKRVIKKVNGK